MPVYNYSIGTAFTPTGTVAIASGSAVVTGTGTSFLSQFAVGNLIQVSGLWRVITIMTDNTHMTCSANFTTTASGQTAVGVNLTNVESLSPAVSPPKGNYSPFSTYDDLGNGRLGGYGRPTIEWRWGFLTLAERDKMRTFCASPAASSNVYLRSKENEGDAYFYASAVMRWVQGPEERDTGRRLDFVLKFNNVVRLTVS